MNIEINEKNMKIENGKLVVEIDAGLEKLLKIRRLCDVKPGTIINGKYIVLEQLLCDTAIVIRKELLTEPMNFDENNNDWKSSSRREYLNSSYLKEVEDEFGGKNILPHYTDLLSLDGLGDYGECIDKIGLLSIDQYRKYRKLLTPVDRAWWLVTPDSTPSGTGSSYVQCVSSYGAVSFDGCRWWHGVRPFFYLKSDIFVSCDN